MWLGWNYVFFIEVSLLTDLQNLILYVLMEVSLLTDLQNLILYILMEVSLLTDLQNLILYVLMEVSLLTDVQNLISYVLKCGTIITQSIFFKILTMDSPKITQESQVWISQSINVVYLPILFNAAPFTLVKSYE